MKSQKKHHFQKKAMHFKSPLAMGQDAFKSKHASSVSISEVIDTGVNSNLYATAISPTIPDEVSVA